MTANDQAREARRAELQAVWEELGEARAALAILHAAHLQRVQPVVREIARLEDAHRQLASSMRVWDPPSEN